MKDLLSVTHPHLAVQWHPTRNGTLTPDQVTAGSNKKVWWQCPNAPDHEWEAVINSRRQGNGCPCCAGYKVSVTNSLSSISPQLAQEWHPTKNGVLTPERVVAGSSKKAWWKCPKELDHEWEATINSRVRGNGCPCCDGRKPSITNSLASLFPEIAKELHPMKNGGLTPDQVVAYSGNKVWWKCAKGIDHEWQTTPNKRTSSGTGCPYCAGQKVSVTNSLAVLYPELSQEWHPTNNGSLNPNEVIAGSGQKVWWQCSRSSEHEWQAAINNRIQGRGCPYCSGRKVSATNSLASLYPEIAQEWHPTKNGTLTPDQVVAGSHSKAWWICPKSSDHEWDAVIVSRVSGRKCPYCAHQKLSVTNSLASLYPEIAKEWHPTKNGDLTPNQVIAGSNKRAWWICPNSPDHTWKAVISSRVNGTGCPFCNQGWTVEAIRGFIASLIKHLGTFTSAELYLLFQQSGLLQSTGKGKGFIKALTTGRFPKEEIEKFINGEPSIVDKFLQDKQLTLEAIETSSNNDIPNRHLRNIIKTRKKRGNIIIYSLVFTVK